MGIFGRHNVIHTHTHTQTHTISERAAASEKHYWHDIYDTISLWSSTAPFTSYFGQLLSFSLSFQGNKSLNCFSLTAIR